MPATPRIPSLDELRLLISFLNDPSDHTVSLAKSQLKNALLAHPPLRAAMAGLQDVEAAPFVRQLLEEIRLDALFEDWKVLARGGADLDLEHGTVLLSRLVYPGVEREAVRHTLDTFAEGAERLIDSGDSSPRQSQALLGRYLFQDLGFHGNTTQYDDPDNSFIVQVLERRIGLPITLTCVYLFVAWRLGLPVYGVGLPGHFIAGHVIEGRPLYIDAFFRGRLLTVADCAQLVRRRGIDFQDRFLAPMAKNQILARMIVNLVTLYTEQGQEERAQWLGRVLALIQETP